MPRALPTLALAPVAGATPDSDLYPTTTAEAPSPPSYGGGGSSGGPWGGGGSSGGGPAYSPPSRSMPTYQAPAPTPAYEPPPVKTYDPPPVQTYEPQPYTPAPVQTYDPPSVQTTVDPPPVQKPTTTVEQAPAVTPPSMTTTVAQAPVTTPEKPVTTTPVTTTAAPVTTSEKPTTSSSVPTTTSEKSSTSSSPTTSASSSPSSSSPTTTASSAGPTTASSSAEVSSPSEPEHSGHSTDPSDTTSGKRPEGSRVPVPDGERDTEGPVTDVLPVVPKPPVIEAPQQNVQAARNAPPVVVDVVNPPPPPPTAPRVDIYQQVNTVIQNNTNVVVNNTVVANSLEVTYNDYHQPTFINPYREDFRVRYFYGGSYREIWVPVGGRIVIPVPVVGIYPFTAVSAHHVWAGDFCGGSYMAPVGWVGPPPPTWRPPPPPVVYTNREVRVVSANRVVRVASVKVAGRDETRPVGQRETFMVNETTLAWGETKPDGQIDIAATQTLPGVGPVDNGGSLITTALAAHEEKDHSLWVLGGGLAVLLATVVGVFGRTRRRPKDNH